MVRIGFDPSYQLWVLHGKHTSSFEQNEASQLPDAHRMYHDAYIPFAGDSKATEGVNMNVDNAFRKKLEEAEAPLYPSCSKYTKMSTITTLYKHKVTNGLSDKAFNELLEILLDMLPEENDIPDSLYKVKKFLKEFDLGYEDTCLCQ